jgi:hypothetical protein
MTGSEYFKTAFEDKFESVSPIDCGKTLDVLDNRSIIISANIFEIWFIQTEKG